MKKPVVGCLDGGQIFLQDSFDRANGPLGNAEIGGAWVAVEGTIAVSSNKAKGTVSGTSYAAIQVTPLDYVLSADIVWSTGDTIAFVFRGSSASSDNQMRIRIVSGSISLTRRLSGSNTDLATYSYTWTSGATHKIKVVVSGNTFTCYLDDAQILTTTNDNATKTQTYVGVLVSAASTPASTFDNIFVEE